MLRLMLTVVALILLVQGVDAAKAKRGKEGLSGNSCWVRVYTAKELRQHRRQQVTEIRLLANMQPDGRVAASLHMNLRKRINVGRYDYTLSGFCKNKGTSLLCTPERDAGTFVLEQGARNGLRVKNRKLVVNPSNYDSEDIADNAVKLGKSDDAIWLLFAAAPAACAAN